MNHVIAQGAPGSLIRYFQENPHQAVDLLRLSKDVVFGNNGIVTENAGKLELCRKINQIENEMEGRSYVY